MKAKVFSGQASLIEGEMTGWIKNENPQKIVWASQSCIPIQVPVAQNAGKTVFGTVPDVTVTILYE